MIQRVHLEFIESKVKFFVDLLPSEIPDFLVLYQTFARKFDEFKREPLVGKVVTVRQKSNQIRVKLLKRDPWSPKSVPSPSGRPSCVNKSSKLTAALGASKTQPRRTNFALTSGTSSQTKPSSPS